MARSAQDKLQRLRKRRSGRPGEITADGRILDEAFEKRASTDATRYALGAMQAVDGRYTQISHEEGERVRNNLAEGLDAKGLRAEYRLQGSLPLDVHIKGVSDVDLLVIEPRYVETEYCPNSLKSYLPYSGLGTIPLDILALRANCKDILERKFWGAKVDDSGAKCIKLTEGSLRRDVDVVPSAWDDTNAYQLTLNETERGVIVFDKLKTEKINNFPFKYMAKINEKNASTAGGAKMAIRLLKNVKSDEDEDSTLSSYDLGGLIYHCPDAQIYSSPGADLFILSGVDQWLWDLCCNYQATTKLVTPDGTRRIVDSNNKWASLVRLSQHISQLANDVSGEVIHVLPTILGDRQMLHKHLREHMIPLAA